MTGSLRTVEKEISKYKMDLTETGWGEMDWIDQAADRDHWKDLANTVMNLRVP
jgi:hypothetical protein